MSPERAPGYHALFRESLGQLLDTEPDFRMVAHCGACQEALDALSREVIDLALLDYGGGVGLAPVIARPWRTLSACRVPTHGDTSLRQP